MSRNIPLDLIIVLSPTLLWSRSEGSTHKAFSVLSQLFFFLVLFCPKVSLKSTWVPKLQNNIRECSAFLSKHWTNWEAIECSRTKHLVGSLLMFRLKPPFSLYYTISCSLSMSEISYFMEKVPQTQTVHAEAYCPWRCYFPQLTAK